MKHRAERICYYCKHFYFADLYCCTSKCEKKGGEKINTYDTCPDWEEPE